MWLDRSYPTRAGQSWQLGYTVPTVESADRSHTQPSGKPCESSVTGLILQQSQWGDTHSPHLLAKASAAKLDEQ